MTAGLLSRRYLTASIAVYTAVALVAFEGTAVAAALPQLAGDLGRLDLLPWTVTAYLFASGVTTVMAGPLVDSMGTRVVFRWAAIVFAGAGFAAGLSTDMLVLIVIRLIQGAGSGMLIAATLTAVNLMFPDELVGRAFAANSTVWGVMGAASPAIAAFMLTALSWRWIFFINLPLGALSLLAGWRRLPGAQENAESRSVDWWGVALIAGFTLTALLAIDRLGVGSIIWGGIAVALAGLYAAHARRRAQPVVWLEHLITQPYLGIGATVGLMIAAGMATNIYVTLYVSAGRGASPTATAWSVLFFVIGWTTGANLSSRLLDRMAETTVMSGGAASTALGLSLAAPAVMLSLPLPFLFTGLFFAGAGVGMATNAALSLLRAATPPNQIGRATAAHQFIRNQGFTLGAGIGGAVLLLVVGNLLGSVEPVQRLLAGEDAGITAGVADAVRTGYGTTALVSVAIAFCALVPMVVLRRHLAAARAEKTAVRRQAVADES